MLIVTDEGVAATGIPGRAAESMQSAGLKPTVFSGAHVEPTDESFRAAAAFAGDTDWDGFVAVGGGSSIDTAKAINLLTTNPGDLMDYVNKPVGGGQAPTMPLKPLVAVPTTAGTGAESTAMCILDILSLKVKTGISHPRLRPVLAVVDPLTTLTTPPHVTASCGMDILCHALESLHGPALRVLPRAGGRSSGPSTWGATRSPTPSSRRRCRCCPARSAGRC